MAGVQRIDEIIELLQDFALGEVDLPEQRAAALLALLNITVPNARQSDDGGEALMFVRPRFAS